MHDFPTPPDHSFGKLLLRLGIGGMILLHGIAKILHPESLQFIGEKLAAFGIPAEAAYLVYVGEVLAPLLVIFGLMTRFGALMIVINMLVAIVLVHSHEVMQLTKHGGWAIELQALYLLGGLVIFFIGSGRYALSRD